MFNSKAIKDNVFDKTSYSIGDLIPWRFEKYYKSFKRACAYFIQGWNSPDWDHAFIFEDLVFKLKRVQNDILTDPYHVVEKTTGQSIKIVIKLLERYKEDSYYFHLNKHDSKWGVGEMVFSKEEGSTPDSGSRLTVVRKHVIIGVNDEQERKEFLEAIKKDYAMKQKDLDLAFKIIARYNETWWT